MAQIVTRSLLDVEEHVCMAPSSQKLTELRRVHLHGLHCLQIVTELRGARLHGPILSEAD